MRMAELQVAIVPVTPFQQNCAILWDKESGLGAVVDPGGDVRRIEEALAKLGVTAEKILLTHGHIDHAGGADELRAALTAAQGRPVPVEGPGRQDLFLLQGLAEQGRSFGLTEARAVTPDRWLDEGEQVSVGGHAFAVLHVPGHTPGHLVFFQPQSRFAVVGDTLFHGSIGRTDFPYGDQAALLAGIRGKLLTLGDDVAFICGHGPNSSIGDERRGNPFVGEAAER
jgi:glyoxylase-like metal-dependent hydrolase (beta-lactamase superfamily II)